VHAGAKAALDEPMLEDTTDPILQKAIVDTVRRPVHFRSMRAILAPPHAAPLAAASAGHPVAVPEVAHDVAQIAVPQPKVQHHRSSIGWHAPSAAWLAGLAVFSVFVLTNVVVQLAYSGRVFPGVKVGGVSLSGVAFGSESQMLAGSSKAPSLTVRIGDSTYDAGAVALAGGDTSRAVREAEAVGHSTPLPLAGLVEALMSKPIEWHYEMDNTAVRAFAERVAADSTVTATPALPVVDNGQVFVIDEHHGYSVDPDKLVGAIRDGYGKTTVINFVGTDHAPLVTSGAIQSEIDDAQTMLSATLQVKVKTATYQPTAQEVGRWIVFPSTGQSPDIDPAAVARYVSGISGSFDRAATVNAIVTAARAKSDLSYTASVSHPTGNPTLAGLTPSVATMVYCVRSDTPADADSLSQTAGGVLSSPTGWSLGGHLKWVLGEKDCNINLSISSVAEMSRLSANCVGLASCQSSSVLAFSSDSWRSTPKAWTGSLATYRGELVNHEVGHWLGFDHGSCSQPTSKPVLGVPAVVIPGCSPNWYVVTAQVPGVKAWPPL
jgi:hypothetical protein